MLAGAIAVLAILGDLDDLGRVFCLAAITILSLAGVVFLWLSRRTPADATVTPIPAHPRCREQVRYYRSSLWGSAFAFPILTIWIAYDLHQLEIGAVKEARVVVPVNLIYEHFGYWAAVLSTPVVGAICCAVMLFKLRKLSAQDPS